MAKEDTFETLRFLTPELCFEIADKVGTPCYAYDLDTLKKCVPLQLRPVHACFAVLLRSALSDPAPSRAAGMRTTCWRSLMPTASRCATP